MSKEGHNLRMNRFKLTGRIVAKLKNNEAVIGGIGFGNFDLWANGHRPENFYMLGSMGLACPIAFGVALAQPKRRVIALEGDGSLLMQLGCLSTIAVEKPKNLAIVVWDNGGYMITGGQATTTAATADLVTIAKGCGIADSHWANDEAEFDRLIDRALTADGPIFIGVKIDRESAVAATHRDPILIREQFMQGIKARPDAFGESARKGASG